MYVKVEVSREEASWLLSWFLLSSLELVDDVREWNSGVCKYRRL
jgi:hypothetical protein